MKDNYIEIQKKLNLEGDGFIKHQFTNSPVDALDYVGGIYSAIENKDSLIDNSQKLNEAIEICKGTEKSLESGRSIDGSNDVTPPPIDITVLRLILEYYLKNSENSYRGWLKFKIAIDVASMAQVFRGVRKKNINTSPNSSCFVATAVYEDCNHKKVIRLRRFRDETLSKSFLGNLFIKLYYKYGPYLAIAPKRIPFIKKSLRVAFDLFIKS